jgi:hypothetical protein
MIENAFVKLYQMLVDNIDFSTDDFLIMVEETLKRETSTKDLETIKSRINAYQNKIDNLVELKLENMINVIESRNPIYESELLGSLGISGFGKKKFHDLLQQGTYDGILEMCFNGDWSSLATYKGIQAKNAKTLVEGIKANEDTIEFIENSIEILPEPMDLKSGMHVAFSKCRDKELEKWLLNRAIHVSDTVNNDVSFVVIPNMSSSSTKIDKARKLKIPLVLLGENGEGVKEYIRKNYRKV